MAEYSVGVKISLTVPSDIKSQIQQIQNKINEQNLKFNIGISPEVMNGLERLGKLSQDVVDKINKQKIDWSSGNFQANLDSILNGLSRFGTVTKTVKDDFGKVTITVEDELNKIKKYVLQANQETEKLNKVSYSETENISGNSISKATSEQLKQEIKLQEQKQALYEKSIAQMQASYKPIQQQIQETIALRQKEIEQLQKQAEIRVNSNQRQSDTVLNEQLKIEMALQKQEQERIKTEQDLTHYIDIQTQKFENQIAILEKRRGNLVTSQDLSSLNGGVLDLKNVSNMDEATKKVQNLQAAMKTVDTKAFVEGFDAANSHAMSFGQSIETAAYKMGVWVGVGGILFGVLRQLKDGFAFIKDIDTQLTHLSMEMFNTTLNYKQITSESNNYASSLGSTTSKVVEAVEIFGNFNSTLEQTLERSKAAIVLSNLTGDGIKESSDQLQSLGQQYGYSSDQYMKLNDVLASTAMNLQIDYPKAISEVANGVKQVGSFASETGLSLQRLSAIVGVTADKTRLSGDTIGKLIAA